MSYQMIKFAKNEAIATITLNRPEKYNTLRLEMLHEMENALMDANEQVIVSAVGSTFPAGWSTTKKSMKTATIQASIFIG